MPLRSRRRRDTADTRRLALLPPRKDTPLAGKRSPPPAAPLPAAAATASASPRTARGQPGQRVRPQSRDGGGRGAHDRPAWRKDPAEGGERVPGRPARRCVREEVPLWDPSARYCPLNAGDSPPRGAHRWSWDISHLCRLAGPLPRRSRGSVRRQLALSRLKGEWDRKLSSSGTCSPPRRCLTEAFKNGPRWRGWDGTSLSPFPSPGQGRRHWWRAVAAVRAERRRQERPPVAGHGRTPRARTKVAASVSRPVAIAGRGGRL